MSLVEINVNLQNVVLPPYTCTPVLQKKLKWSKLKVAKKANITWLSENNWYSKQKSSSARKSTAKPFMVYVLNELFHLFIFLNPIVYDKISYKIMFANMSLHRSRWYRRAAFPQEASPPKNYWASSPEHFQIQWGQEFFAESTKHRYKTF